MALSLGIREMAAELGLSERSVFTLAHRDRDPLPSCMLGARRVFPVAAVSEWILRQPKGLSKSRAIGGRASQAAQRARRTATADKAGR